MGESDCFVISIYYWIGLQQDSVPAARVCLCADLFKSIMFPHVCTVYAHRLTFSVPRLLPPLCVLLSTFVLSLALFYSVFWLSSPVFIPHLSLPSSFHPLTHPHTHLSLSVSLSLPLQCIRHITGLLLQSQLSLQQPALKLMAESGDEQLLQLTLEQINSMTAVSVISPYSNADHKWSPLHEPQCIHVFK